MTKTSFYDQEELDRLGLKRCGRDVKLSRLAQIYQPELLAIGDHSRIDDFCILAGTVTLGRNVHLSAFCALHGAHGITLEDFSTVSGRSTLYTESDDYVGGRYLTNPTIPAPFHQVADAGPIRVCRHAIVGCASVILPGAIVGTGAAVGAMALIKGTLDDWGIYAGIPARKVGQRPHETILKLEADYLAAEPTPES